MRVDRSLLTCLVWGSLSAVVSSGFSLPSRAQISSHPCTSAVEVAAEAATKAAGAPPIAAEDSAHSTSTRESQCTASGEQNLSSFQPDQTDFVRAAQMLKLTLTPPDSSNRLELNHFQPISLWDQSILFVDNTVYAKTKPFESSDEDLPFIDSWGDSIRLGYRQLIKNTTAFFGINGGYDAAFVQGYYFQQVGLGFEGVFPGLTIQATLTQGLGLTFYEQLGKSLLSSFNVQAGFPTGIPSLSMATRFYYVNNQLSQSSPGGQIQLVYGINRHLSANISASYDNVGGFGSSLQFRYLFRPPNPAQVPSTLSYGIASSFGSAIGNTGSRILRITGTVPAMGD